MPSLSTAFAWRRTHGDFDERYRMAKQVQAERICDKAEALADAATPQTAYLTHVRLAHLRWWAGVLAPRKYRIRMSEPDTPRETITVLHRRFEIEDDPETGKPKVVGYFPNPYTGQVEREDTPGWQPPPNTIGLPVGGTPIPAAGSATRGEGGSRAPTPGLAWAPAPPLAQRRASSSPSR
jgi:hypothetical protein